MRTVNFVTSNLSKFEEAKAILDDDTSFKILQSTLELPELQAEFDEVVINKCMTAATVIQGPILVDDTGPVLFTMWGDCVRSFHEQVQESVSPS